MARMFPVEGWMTTIELSWWVATAARAAASALALIVVARLGMLFGGMTTAWLFGITWFEAVWISTYRPGVPRPGGALPCSNPTIVVSPASWYVVRSFPLASLTETTWGDTMTAARWVEAVRFGARTSGAQAIYHSCEFRCW